MFGALNPWLLLAFVSAVLLSGAGGLAAGYKAAGDAKDAQYNAERVEASKNALKAVENAVRANDEYRLQQLDRNRKTIAAYRQRLADLDRVEPHGGLRLPADACRPAVDPAPAVAGGAGGTDDPGAGTVELPPRIADDLFRLTKRADRLAEQLRALQQWIKGEGLDGG